jgi:hypothetical protein
MEKNIMLIVSDETYDKTAAESVKPSSENRHTAARFGEMVKSVIGRAARECWTSVPPGHEATSRLWFKMT